MKILAFILSAFVLVLTVMPCIDKCVDNTLQNNELVQITNSSNHQSNTDQCSPFCTCQCCHTNYNISSSPTLLLSAASAISYNEYSPSFQSPDLFDFLIPPKS